MNGAYAPPRTIIREGEISMTEDEAYKVPSNIQWVDQNKTQNFRSTLELIRLIDDALEGTQRISWDKESEEIG